MRGAFNDYIGAAVAETRARNAQRGTCIYYRAGLCACESKPRCVDYAMGVCDSNGVCVTRHHYQTPAAIFREEMAVEASSARS